MPEQILIAEFFGLILPPLDTVLPVVKVLALDSRSGNVVGESFTSPYGEYAIRIHRLRRGLWGSLNGIFGFPQRQVELRVVDGAGRTLAAQSGIRCDPGGTVHVDLEISATNMGHVMEIGMSLPQPSRPFVNRSDISVITRALEERGQSPAGLAYISRLADSLEPLGGLLDDARSVIDGNSTAAERLRYALLRWNAEPWFASIVRVQSQPATLAALQTPTAFKESGIVQRTNVMILVMGTIHAAYSSREAQSMLDVLGAALWPALELEHLLQAALISPTGGGLGTLMGFGGPDGPGGLPPLPLPGPGDPGDGGSWLPPLPLPGPGFPLGPKPAPDGPDEPTGSPWTAIPHLRIPILANVSIDFCIRETENAISDIEARAKRYEIQSLSKDDACTGDLLSIHGRNFGATGLVIFPARGGSSSLTSFAFPESWSDSEVIVRVPAWAAPGIITLRILEKTVMVCAQSVSVYRLGITIPYFNGGIPEVYSVTVNLRDNQIAVPPNADIAIGWVTSIGRNVTVHVQVQKQGVTIFDRSGLAGGSGSLSFHTPDVNEPTLLKVLISAGGTCGFSDAKELPFTVTTLARLTIEGVEVTQGIQAFWRDGVAWNAVQTVAGKDTIVRVYASANRDGFFGDKLAHMSARLIIAGVSLSPINGQQPNGTGANPFIDLASRSKIKRENANHTFNFRIPAALSLGTQSMRIQVFGHDELSFRQAELVVAWSWVSKKPLRVRWILIHDGRPGGTGQQTTDAQALDTVFRAFDLLPSPPTDIGPAWLHTWNTGENWDSQDGKSTLLHHLDDQHDCTLWEQIWPWSDDCPSDDRAKWYGVIPGSDPGGLSNTGGNTAIGGLDKRTCAHELGHTLCLLHVNRGCGNIQPDTSHRCDSDFGRKAFDNLPDGGRLADVPFDPSVNDTVVDPEGVFDLMTYACMKWTTLDNWGRILRIDF